MSTVALTPTAASAPDLAAPFSGKNVTRDVVEIGLLLPADWAADLIELSKKRQQSVGQLLRTIIGRALFENEVAS
jgi:hypothetical protein